MGDKVPLAYRETYFFADSYGQGPADGLGWIRNALIDPATDRLIEVRDFRAPGDGSFPVALAVDPEGRGLYYAHHSLYSGPNTGEIRRISFDCNANGVADDQDISDETSEDDNGNGVPDECESCIADLDGSGAVDFGDILAILAAWGNAGGPEDLNGSGEVEFGDILVVLEAWGPCP